MVVNERYAICIPTDAPLDQAGGVLTACTLPTLND